MWKLPPAGRRKAPGMLTQRTQDSAACRPGRRPSAERATVKYKALYVQGFKHFSDRTSATLTIALIRELFASIILTVLSVSINAKLRHCATVVRPDALYGAECLTLNKKMIY